jgi:hypothetical protein
MLNQLDNYELTTNDDDDQLQLLLDFDAFKEKIKKLI